MKRFTMSEKAAGELAVRDMSARAREAYDGSDILTVAEYTDYEASREAEEAAERAGVDFFAGEFEVVRYAVIYSGTVTAGLTFEEAERYLEGLADDEEF